MTAPMRRVLAMRPTKRGGGRRAADRAAAERGAVERVRRGSAGRVAPRIPDSERTTASWSEIKAEIVRRYATAYSQVMSRQAGLATYYIEGFSRPSWYLPELFEGFLPTSVLQATVVEPRFRHYFLVDLDGGPATELRDIVGGPDVTLLEGDGNELLLQDVLPRVRAEDYRRALCVLDPPGLSLDWCILEAAGRLRTIDLFVTLPVVDEHGVALWTIPRPNAQQAARMTRAWGDDSWRAVVDAARAKAAAKGAGTAHAAIAAAFARRLREVARFGNVLEPFPIPDRTGTTVVGYLFFASRTDTANHVLEEIFARHRG